MDALREEGIAARSAWVDGDDRGLLGVENGLHRADLH